VPALTPTTSIVLPSLSSGSSPLPPAAPQPATSPLGIPASSLLGPGVWSSPLPWAAVGVLFFGGMAWLVIAIARQLGSDRSA
jgi:hypothetical protein